MNKIEFSAYAVSYKDLISIWIETLHEDDSTIVVLDPANHLEFLKKLNLGHDSLKNLYESKILTLSFREIDQARSIFSAFKPFTGPYAQLYLKGKYITDNIEG